MLVATFLHLQKHLFLSFICSLLLKLKSFNFFSFLEEDGDLGESFISIFTL
jgi:hypothetical protein